MKRQASNYLGKMESTASQNSKILRHGLKMYDSHSLNYDKRQTNVQHMYLNEM